MFHRRARSVLLPTSDPYHEDGEYQGLLGVSMRFRASAGGVLALSWVLALQSGHPASAQPSFRAGVELVAVTAVVSDRGGRPVRELTREDFQVFDDGELRPIIEFWTDESAALSLALVLDVSGSMRVGSKMADARSTANQLLARLRDGLDEAAVFTFDSRLHEVQPYTTDRLRLQQSLDGFKPFGATSLYDAIAETAQRASERTTRHRAVVVLSDGLDTRSELTAADVSGIATSIDVPVYLVAVVSPLDHPDAPTASDATAAGAGRLRDLARWTGGGVYFASAPSQASQAATSLLAELRQQYVIGFEPAGAPGWRRIEVRVPNLQVRTRSAYWARD